ncbi:hypothetical protein BHE74_00056467 [Ensete ventricosum]|nr:hypothetical protein BHE74_00056467 [Ensete ventricosum]
MGSLPRPPDWGRCRKGDLVTWALLLAPNVGVAPQRGMMNHHDEVTRVRKFASVAQRRGNSVPITGWPPRQTVVTPPAKRH